MTGRGLRPSIAMFMMLAVCATAGCARLIGIEDLPPLGDAGAPDGNDAAAPDAGGCGAIRLALRVDGEDVPITPGSAPVEMDVLVGDVIELSAAGSCTPAGDVSYQWQITPNDDTADPGLGAETITFYPAQVAEYVVSIVIRDDRGSQAGGQVLVTAHGWQAVEVAPGNDDVTDIRDLDSSGEDLWIASGGGPYRLPLIGVQNLFFSLNSELTGEIIVGDLTAVHYTSADDSIWFGSGQILSVVWQVDIGSSPPISNTLNISTPTALKTSARIRDITPHAAGVAVTTDKGLTDAADAMTFLGNIEPNGDIAFTTSNIGDRRWAGGRMLYDLDTYDPVTKTVDIIDPFPAQIGTDRQIRALAVDLASDELWVASGNQGIAHLSHATGVVLATYTTDHGLPSNLVRHLRVENQGPHAGDVWAATDAGVARYMRARDAWIAMDLDHGLDGHTDVKAIAIDEAGGRRAIYAGTLNGIAYIRVP